MEPSVETQASMVVSNGLVALTARGGEDLMVVALCANLQANPQNGARHPARCDTNGQANGQTGG